MNKVILVGFLGADPEIRVLESGRKLANIRLATNETYATQSGEIKTHTEWHQITAWGETATYAQKFLRTGSHCRVEGKIRSYTTPGTKINPQENRVFEILASNIQLLQDAAATSPAQPAEKAPTAGEKPEEMKSPQPRTAPVDVDNLPF